MGLLSCSLSAQKPNYIHLDKYVLLGRDTIHYTYAFDQSLEQAGKLVIIIPGSGPTDRNGNSMVMKGNGQPYKMLADSLSKKGFASVRYDKPGVGQSTYVEGEERMLFDLNVQVVQALIKAEGKKELKIYLAGHSEGSLVGMLAAQRSDVSGFISMAGPARNASEVLKGQLSESPGLSAELKKDCLQNIDSLAQGYKVKKYNPLLASLFRPSVQPYLISWFAYTPTEEIEKLDIPVLIIQGKKDLQVPAAASEALAHFAADAELKLYDQMNHVFKNVTDDAENRSSYTDPDMPISEEMVADLTHWLKAH